MKTKQLTEYEQNIYNKAMTWLNEKERSKQEIALKICESINITHDIVSKHYSSNNKLKELVLTELLRPPRF